MHVQRQGLAFVQCTHQPVHIPRFSFLFYFAQHVSVHTLLVRALVAELFITRWPLTLLTLLVKDERQLFL